MALNKTAVTSNQIDPSSKIIYVAEGFSVQTIVGKDEKVFQRALNLGQSQIVSMLSLARLQRVDDIIKRFQMGSIDKELTRGMGLIRKSFLG